ncbi:hypothetical protein RKD55_003173 [Rossellomorea marisflavi]
MFTIHSSYDVAIPVLQTTCMKWISTKTTRDVIKVDEQKNAGLHPAFVLPFKATGILDMSLGFRVNKDDGFLEFLPDPLFNAIA